MSHTESNSWFSDQLVGIQKGLYAYILTLLPWPEEASDVLQQTNLVLWRDSAKFQIGTDFRAWAYRVAYFQVLAQRRKVQRDRLRFDDALMQELAANMDREAVYAEEEALILQDCMKLLPAKDRELICRRYDAGVSVKTMAADLNQSPNAVAVKLHRVRQKLLECMEQRGSERDSR
ncbi:MAG: sigma-70 family RNA polymerase sigma factor [Pirellulaceae bacterium]|nr:sigma-70 family RNA polymerase sigma factor [Pirellulaceae bacterium]